MQVVHTVKLVAVKTKLAPLVLSFAAHAAAVLALVAPGSGRSTRTDAPAAEAKPALGGETFELPAPDTLAAPRAAPPETLALPAPAVGPGESMPRAVPRAAARAHARSTPPGAGATSEATAPPSLFGALGDRSATDLPEAFTRGFPQAASADPVWRSTALGDAGRAVVVLEIDGDGHLTSSRIEGAPSPALTSAIRRTLALLGTRPFVARARTTRLVLDARVSADEIPDGLHGDVFAIGGSFAGRTGHAFFALAIGRRVDLTVSEAAR